MKEHFQLLKDSISLTKKSLETVANDSASEKRFVVNFVCLYVASESNIY